MTRVVPNSFQGIEIWRICWEIGDLDIFAMIAKPIPYGAIFVIRRIVLDEINFLREVTVQNYFEILDISLRVEYILKMIQEAATVSFDGPEDFERVALTHAGNFRLVTYSCPCLMKSWVLPETGFVLEEDSCFFAFGFFLISGY